MLPNMTPTTLSNNFPYFKEFIGAMIVYFMMNSVNPEFSVSL